MAGLLLDAARPHGILQASSAPKSQKALRPLVFRGQLQGTRAVVNPNHFMQTVIT